MAPVHAYDASDPEQVSLAEKDQEDREQDILFVLGQARGRRWLYEFIWGQCHKDRPSFVPGENESTAFNEGARSVGATLENIIRDRSPKMYMKMLEENHFDE
ncbi:hypothetical protein [uncultured Cobetia sp.]|jgi:hypothetical protein|uniref:Bbp19 family protein n=1 Tax=uncultured Cobetia sp. TaxID=410706 RepID=UPI0030ED520E|tara:strand:- start:5525 stop:5830 length:306 start_codon:yes stop_codon:yes gene_type:complete